MNSLLLTLILPMSLGGSLLYLLVLLLSPLTSRLRAKWRRGMLVLCLTLFLVPFGLALRLLPAKEMPFSLEAAPVAAPAYRAGENLSDAFNGGTTKTLPKPIALPSEGSTAQAKDAASPLPGLWQLAGPLYLAGFAVASGTTLFRYTRLMKRLKKSRVPVADADALETLHRFATAKSLKSPPTLFYSEAVSSPLLAGLLHPFILLPAGAIPSEDLAFALEHELTHLAQGDLLFKAALNLACALHWMNPFAALLRRSFAAACEDSCDETLAATLGSTGRKAYAASLLRFSFHQPGGQYLSAFASPAKALKKRLEKLLHPSAPSRLLRVVGAATGVLALCAALMAGCGLAAGAGSASPEGENNPPPSQPVSLPASLPPSSVASDTTAASSATGDETLPPKDILATVPPPKGRLLCPVPTATHISRGFVEDGHRGVDFCAEAGATVVASGSGTVTIAEYHYSFGNYIVIDHGDGLKTLYAHCKELSVTQGQQVEAGQPIATVGSTGNSSGPQCHLEVTVDDTLIDPLTMIDLPPSLKAPAPASTTTAQLLAASSPAGRPQTLLYKAALALAA